MNPFVVSKFGGTSMGDAASMIRSAKICIRQKSNVVVVSATSGTTNDLISMGKLAEAQKWEEAEILYNKLIDRHQQIVRELGIQGQDFDNRLNGFFDGLQTLIKGIYLIQDCSDKAMDALVSYGELISSTLFTECLKKTYQEQDHSKPNANPLQVNWLDVRRVLITDYDYGKAKPDFRTVEKRCQEELISNLNQNHIYVTQGFIGATPEGHTTTLGRGGSDYSAAILAEGLHAKALEVWTDVAGIASTDPRICSDAVMIDDISYQEAAELATFGAKVLHPATLLPAMRKEIPTFVGSSFDSEQKGTWINRKATHYPLVRAIALRTKQSLLTLTTPEMLNASGFLFKIFKVFEDHKVSVDAVTTSEISIAMTVDSKVTENKSLLSKLSEFAELQIENNLNLVALIGNNINHTPGLANKIFMSISDINVRMICLGASRHNFCFLVDESRGSDAVRRLHKELIK